ncbi:MAG TPA: GNAT family N-acetyltransferase [Thermoanaerobaculaceae bacterium]|nr:GNAT family N-acetyltransferase [Thermoanaerobaculaceae bacterium]
MVDFELLGAPVPREFSAMTFPAYRHLLSLQVARRHEEEANRPPIQPLAVAASVRGQAVGLALAELPLVVGGSPELLSLYVAPHLRNVGVGSALLGALEQEVAGRGFVRLQTVYMTGKPAIPAFERVLAKRGWDAPAVRTISVRFTVEQIDTFPWINRYRLPAGFTIFPWAELTEDDRRELRASQEGRRWIASDLQPWDHDSYGFEPITSLGLRGPAGVVGWVINHAISETTLRFTCSYIRKDLGRRGRIVPVYSASLLRAKGTRFKDCTFVAPVQHPTMVHFVRKWMEPWVSFVGETRGSEKRLAVPERTSDAASAAPRPGTSGGGAEPAGATADTVAERGSSQPAAFDPQR